MSSLTDEQKKRIEENRLKALERRAAFLKKKKNNFSENENKSTSISLNPNNQKSFISLDSTQQRIPQNPNESLKCKLFDESKMSKLKHDNSVIKKSYSLFNNKEEFMSSENSKVVFNVDNRKNNGLSGDDVKADKKLPKLFEASAQNVIDPLTKNTKRVCSSESSINDKCAFYGKKVNGNFLLCSRDRFIVNVPYHAKIIEIFKTIPSKHYDIKTKKWSFNISDHHIISSALNQLRPTICISPLPCYILQALKKAANYPPISSIDLMSLDPLLLEAFLPFQREGVCFGISRNGRVLIADDMGLGKTLQALGIATYFRNEWPLLIVTPSSVRYSWAEAIDRWIENIDSHEVNVVNSGKDSLDGTVVIMSYDLLSKRSEEIKKMKFPVIIMDESHMLKNFKSFRYKAAAPLMKCSKRLILLSGTPALSRPNELYTQISAIEPKLIPNFQDYGIRYCGGKQQPWGWDFSGSSNMEELQILLEASIMIRRLKIDVISQLPAKQRMTIILDPKLIKLNSKMMQEAAKNFQKESLRGVEKHGALIQFFNESSYAKVDAVCDYVKELTTDEENKFLVFAHHKVMLSKICETCEKQKVNYIKIDGSTSSENRQKLVDQFQTNLETRVAVLSITAANAGITLTAAHLVVFAELYWNPGLLVQAEDRVHRIGQDDSVLIQYLVAKGTADDIIWPLVQSKLNILNKAGLSKDNFSSALSAKQKVKSSEGILKYFAEMKEDTSEIGERNNGDLWESDLNDEELLKISLESASTSSLPSTKRKRNRDDVD